jgi:hypothetical protein
MECEVLLLFSKHYVTEIPNLQELRIETRRDEDVKNKTLVTSNPLESDYNRGDTSSAGNNKVSKDPSN